MGFFRSCLVLYILASISGYTLVATAYSEDYLTSSCGKNLARDSGRLETSYGLTYSTELDCSMTITVTQGKRVALMFKRFDMEPTLDGKCVDAFNMYEGASVTGTKLNTDGDMCGFIRTVPNFYSASNQVSFRLQTDNNANYRGFEIIYTAFNWGPCNAGQFKCNNTMCIDGSMRCDELSQCGDDSDEQDCEEYIKLKDTDELPVGLIAGCCVGGLFLIAVIIFIIYKIYEYYKRKQALPADFWSWRGGLYQYPVSDKYSRYDIGIKGRRYPAEYYNKQATIQETEITETTETVTVTTEVQ